jgi:hypothetical protein
MRDIHLKNLKLHDIVSLYKLRGRMEWKSYMESPFNKLHGDPVACIFGENPPSIWAKQPEPMPDDNEPKYEYLFFLQIGTKNYELVAKSTDFKELVKKGDEFQEAYLKTYRPNLESDYL